MGYQSPADHKRESSGRYTPVVGDHPSSEKTCRVNWSDLPLNCPMPHMSLWNGHPRVYLPIHNTGEEKCFYCGTVYTLAPPDPNEPAPPFGRGDAEIESAYYDALEAVKKGAR